jgi:hypothetical protein
MRIPPFDSISHQDKTKEDTKIDSSKEHEIKKILEITKNETIIGIGHKRLTLAKLRRTIAS